MKSVDNWGIWHSKLIVRDQPLPQSSWRSPCRTPSPTCPCCSWRPPRPGSPGQWKLFKAFWNIRLWCYCMFHWFLTSTSIQWLFVLFIIASKVWYHVSRLFGIETFLNFLRVSVSTNLVSKKSLSIGLENFGLKKSLSNDLNKFVLENFGLQKLWTW